MFFKAISNSNTWAKAVRCEIKTTVDTKRRLSRDKKLIKQHNMYLEILDKYGIMTYYFLRTLDKHKTLELKNRKKEIIKSIEIRGGYPEDKWRVFKVDELPKTKEGAAYLDFFDPNAMTIDEFLEMLKD